MSSVQLFVHCVVIGYVYLNDDILVKIVCSSNQQDPSLDTNAWLEKYDHYRKIILENTEITNEDNLTPEIRLHLITPKSRLWTGKAKDSPFKESPFFAFYWAGGQGLTRYILDHPEIVKGKKVLDLGSGCGATAIAAARCGALSVTANDIDPLSCLITQMNAKLNNVNVLLDRSNLIGYPVWCDYDVILVGDVLYNYRDVVLMVPWLDTFDSYENKSVYIGDPGRPYLTLFKRRHHLFRLAEYSLSETSCYLNNYLKLTKVYKYYHVKPRRLKPKQLKIYDKTTRRPRGTKWPKRPTERKQRMRHKAPKRDKKVKSKKKRSHKLKGKIKRKKS